jgi:hypothetical protein
MMSISLHSSTDIYSSVGVAVAAVVRVAVAVALNEGAGHLEEPGRAEPGQRLLDDAARAAYLLAVLAVE